MRLLILSSLLFLSATVSAWEWRDALDVPDKYVRDVMTAELTELECMALNIYHEARGESLLGQQLVAQVTLNRAEHEGFPDTICGVVRQHRQFSWTHDGHVDHAFDRRAYEDAYFIAVMFLVMGQNADVHYSNLLLNYHATRINPGWHNLQAVMVHGDHVFYVRKRELVRVEE